MLASLVLAAGACAGCTNPDAGQLTQGTATPSPQNRGEPQAPAPPSPLAEAPAELRRTPQEALAAFASLYVNWNYQTLASEQRSLAAASVGPARLAEQQAAASSLADPTIKRGQLYNSGHVVSLAPDASRAGTWVIVTLERTGGNSSYEGLPAAYHVTLAQLQRVGSGYAVSQWLPQS